MPLAERKIWAKAIIEEATEHSFDPFTMIAIMHDESRLNPSAENSRGCVGLGQYCLSNIPACRKDRSAQVCQNKRLWLLNWRNAMHQIGADITTWRKYCRRRTGKQALFARWLSGYQGAFYRQKNVTCGMVKRNGRWVDLPAKPITRRVMARRLQLIKDMKRQGIR